MTEQKKGIESPTQLIEERMEAWYGEYWQEQLVLSIYRVTYFTFMNNPDVPEDVHHSLNVLYHLVEGVYSEADQ